MIEIKIGFSDEHISQLIDIYKKDLEFKAHVMLEERKQRTAAITSKQPQHVHMPKQTGMNDVLATVLAAAVPKIIDILVAKSGLSTGNQAPEPDEVPADDDVNLGDYLDPEEITPEMQEEIRKQYASVSGQHPNVGVSFKQEGSTLVAEKIHETGDQKIVEKEVESIDTHKIVSETINSEEEFVAGSNQGGTSVDVNTSGKVEARPEVFNSGSV
jgi:hypothetical protein